MAHLARMRTLATATAVLAALSAPLAADELPNPDPLLNASRAEVVRFKAPDAIAIYNVVADEDKQLRCANYASETCMERISRRAAMLVRNGNTFKTQRQARAFSQLALWQSFTNPTPLDALLSADTAQVRRFDVVELSTLLNAILPADNQIGCAQIVSATCEDRVVSRVQGIVAADRDVPAGPKAEAYSKLKLWIELHPERAQAASNARS